MQIDRQIQIFSIAVAGLLILFVGLHYLLLNYISGISFVPVIAGMGLCICALIMSQGEMNETIGLLRILMIYLISLEILWFGVMGYLMDAKRPLMIYYTVIFSGLIILCLAFFLTYRQLGNSDTRLRE